MWSVLAYLCTACYACVLGRLGYADITMSRREEDGGEAKNEPNVIGHVGGIARHKPDAIS
eukprot:5300790-Pyramimonas_sp.AAC.1